ncbi:MULTISPECIES: rod shape-determining protein MreD [unclassified Colwellia]|uniref:rod shape-determining protein MreD n=1 Tax=unclassified Colwellia TaxID=196834 RepID=UPI0015F61B74|nr:MULTISPECIES: rod shape-determining protein MreD [unclassified Colwellia]MBA6223737.1 rod shape-determining protein MreD [Colwellia sp. MB3u-45]MBA6268467.1 rod shape-determining protein MreD [Colwellia sp. MB3u-43]MBA6288076.1 rod shape-determining protein MreD [Colwellia sp. MB3u-4]MBA6297623.1 rod shape-determining protein MreD [Colwellia sp. MB02u-9]MBA6319918.1 rod shape-determining protein MreD [Colwellia sp. MB02u-19]
MSIVSRLIMFLTLLVALLASIMPLPLSVDAFRPDWVLVVLLYWCLALPSRVNVISAWVMGFILDVLLGSTLGVHAGAMAISVYIVAGNFQKIRNFSVWQQALIMGVLSALYHLIVFWLQRFLTDAVFLPSYLYPVFTTIILWPWAFLLLRKIRRNFRIT